MNRLGRARWKLLVFACGLLSAATAGVLRPAIRNRLAARAGEALVAARADLEAGELTRAAELAGESLLRARRARMPTGLASMTLGIVRARQASDAVGAQRLVYLAAATQHLSDAIHAGVPAELEPELQFHLARCLHARNQFAESIRLLRQTIQAFPAGRVEALQLLTQAYMDPAHLDLQQAYYMNARLLEDPELSVEVMQWSWSIRSEILAQRRQRDLLAGIELQAGDQSWLGGVTSACDRFADRQYSEASRDLAALAGSATLPPRVERRVWYLAALAAREVGDTDSSLAALMEIETRHPGTSEAYHAALFHASVMLEQGESERAVALLSRVAREEPAAELALPIEAPVLARLLKTAIQSLNDQGQYDQTLHLIDSYRHVGGRDAQSLGADTLEAWAAGLIAQAVDRELAEASQLAYQAEELYRKAGDWCLAAADSAGDADAAEWLSRAARNFVEGRGYLQAATTIERLLKIEERPAHRADALALLCAALEKSGKADQVPEIASLCIHAYPAEPATVTARYYLARSMIGFGQPEQAEAQLRAVVDTGNPDADPSVVQQARLALAHLLYDQGRDDEAITRIAEIPSGVPDRDLQWDARLLLADCLHRRAQRPAASAVESQTEHARLHYQNRKQSDLEQALQVFSQLQRQLATLDRSGHATELHADWLRRCRWGMADCLYEADRIEEALDLYRLLADVYREPSDWFAAQLQIANCHVRLNRIDTALAVIRAAHTRLVQLPAEAREQVRVGMAPERWHEWMEWGSRM